MNYVLSASNLRAAVYGINQSKNVDEIKQIVSAMVIPEFQTKSGVKIGELERTLIELFQYFSIEMSTSSCPWFKFTAWDIFVFTTALFFLE